MCLTVCLFTGPGAGGGRKVPMRDEMDLTIQVLTLDMFKHVQLGSHHRGPQSPDMFKLVQSGPHSTRPRHPPPLVVSGRVASDEPFLRDYNVGTIVELI